MKDLEWLNEKLKNKIGEVFESKYKRKLTDDEVVEIALNLSAVVEAVSKHKYGNT
jgi:hypothetical protein